MALKKYTIAEFRKATREAFNEVESGGKVFITRHNTRYELVKADIQNGKVQMAEQATGPLKQPTAVPTESMIERDERIQPGVYNGTGLEVKVTTPAPAINTFPTNGDSGAQIESIADVFGPPSLEKNIADADASKKVSTNADALKEWESEGLAAPVNTLHIARGLMRNQLNGIDIETQDPDEVELGATLAASIEEITGELKKRGAE